MKIYVHLEGCGSSSLSTRLSNHDSEKIIEERITRFLRDVSLHKISYCFGARTGDSFLSEHREVHPRRKGIFMYEEYPVGGS